MSNIEVRPRCAEPSCNTPLYTPIYSLDSCRHNLHGCCLQKIFRENLNPHHCPKCNAVFTDGKSNSALEGILDRLDAAREKMVQAIAKAHKAKQECIKFLIQTEDIELLKEMLQQDPTIASTLLSSGHSPLFFACMGNKLEVARALLEAGAPVDMRNNMIGDGSCDKGSLKYPRQHDVTAITVAITNGNFPLTELLLEYKADPSGKSDCVGVSLLRRAISRSSDEIGELLVNEGADLSVKIVPGSTPILHDAVDFHLIKTIQAMIEQNVDVMEKDNTDGTTVIHKAAADGTAEILATLLKTEAREYINQPDDAGKTPLAYAVDDRKIANIRVLLTAGVDTSIRLEDPLPLEIAQALLKVFGEEIPEELDDEIENVYEERYGYVAALTSGPIITEALIRMSDIEMLKKWLAEDPARA